MGSERAPVTLWAALVLAGMPQLYLSLPGGDVPEFSVLPWIILGLYAYFLIVRRSRIAWWLFIVGGGVRFLADVGAEPLDPFVVLYLTCIVGSVVALVLPGSREWVGM